MPGAPRTRLQASAAFWRAARARLAISPASPNRDSGRTYRGRSAMVTLLAAFGRLCPPDFHQICGESGGVIFHDEKGETQALPLCAAWGRLGTFYGAHRARIAALPLSKVLNSLERMALNPLPSTITFLE